MRACGDNYIVSGISPPHRDSLSLSLSSLKEQFAGSISSLATPLSRVQITPQQSFPPSRSIQPAGATQADCDHLSQPLHPPSLQVNSPNIVAFIQLCAPTRCDRRQERKTAGQTIYERGDRPFLPLPLSSPPSQPTASLTTVPTHSRLCHCIAPSIRYSRPLLFRLSFPSTALAQSPFRRLLEYPPQKSQRPAEEREREK